MKHPQWSPHALLWLVACLAVGQSLAEDQDFQPRALNVKVPIITSPKQLDANVGRLVAVRGLVSDGKIPYILGVEVKAPNELRRKEAYAVGILGRFEVTKSDPGIANSGVGIHYTLYFDVGGKIAEARALPH